MAKDYKDRIPAYRRRNHRRTGRIWGLAGAAALGIAGVLALAMHFFPKQHTEESASANTMTMPMPPASTGQKPGDGKKPAAKEKDLALGKPDKSPDSIPPAEPRFSFYKVLPEKEVIIPENEIKTLKREEESLGKKPQAGVYMVQAGSFTSQQDAEKLKGQLAQIKIKAKLEMIKLENTAWYRVKIGPYATLADADKVRQYLRGNKVDSVVQKATR